MNKKTALLIFFIVFVIAPLYKATAIQAGTIPNAGQMGIESSPISESGGLLDAMAKAVGIIWKVFFIIAVLFILIAAFDFLTAREDAEKIKKAKTQLLYASIAIAIALLAISASTIIQSFLGGEQEGVGSPSYPASGDPSMPSMTSKDLQQYYKYGYDEKNWPEGGLPPNSPWGQ